MAASSQTLAKAIAARLKSHQYEAVKAVTVLGVDAAAGRGGVHRPMKQRASVTVKRKGRFMKLRRMGAKMLQTVRSAGGSAVAYGARVIGTTPAILRTTRGIMKCGLPKASGGTSATLQIMLAVRPRMDPVFMAHELTIAFWAKQAFIEWGPKTQQAAWQRQVPKVGLSKRMWAKVAGPAGAVTASLKQIGWIASSASKWLTNRGVELDLKRATPSTVTKLVQENVTDPIWVNWAKAASAKVENFSRVPGGYWMEPVQEWACKAKRDWSILEAACLSSIVAGGQWPQERLYEHGYTDTSYCWACKRAAGTVGHRAWCCPQHAERRRQGTKPELVAGAVVALEVEPYHPLWTRALMQRSELPAIQAVGPETSYTYRGEHGTTVTRPIFTDGSTRLRPWWPESERSGWSVCSLHKGVLVHGVYGPVGTGANDAKIGNLRSVRSTHASDATVHDPYRSPECD